MNTIYKYKHPCYVQRALGLEARMPSSPIGFREPRRDLILIRDYIVDGWFALLFAAGGMRVPPGYGE